MRVEVKVPQLPESVAEATLVSWHKKAGEAVKRDENLIDIETDKVVLELPAPADGVLVEVLKGDGTTVTSNDVIAVLDTDGKAARQQRPPPRRSRQRSERCGGHARREAAARAGAAETGAAPASRDTPGTKRVAAGRAARGAQDDGRAGRRGERRDRHRTRRPHHQGRRASGGARTKSAPAAEARARRACARRAGCEAAAGVSLDLGNRPEQRVPMSRLRQRVAERLVQSQSTAAILTTFNEVNMQPVIELRNRYKERFEKEHGVKLGFMGFFVKAAVHALKKFPLVNASIDGNDIVYHGYYDIGIAVGSPRGLVVPIIRDADQLSIAEIEKQIADFGKRAQEGKLTVEELTGGTYTISNGGVFGSMLSTPIINPPQSAILGVHATKERAGRRERPGRRPADELPRAVVRPPDHRRPRGGAVAGRDQGSAGGSGAACCLIFSVRSSRRDRQAVLA